MLNTDKYKNSKGLLWLNVASSFYVLEDFVNLDNHIFIRLMGFYKIATKIIPKKYAGWLDSYHEAKQKAVLLRHDCRKPLPIHAQSVDHVLCSHFLEHVYPQECKNILNDFLKVLKPGATLHIILPDIENIINQYLANKKNGMQRAADKFVKDSLLSKESRGSFKYRVLEFNGGFGLQHRWMYDNASISELLKELGFEIIEKTETLPSYAFRLNDDSVHVVCKKRF